MIYTSIMSVPNDEEITHAFSKFMVIALDTQANRPREFPNNDCGHEKVGLSRHCQKQPSARNLTRRATVRAMTTTTNHRTGGVPPVMPRGGGGPATPPAPCRPTRGEAINDDRLSVFFRDLCLFLFLSGRGVSRGRRGLWPPGLPLADTGT